MFTLRMLKKIFSYMYKNKFSRKSLKESSLALEEYKLGYALYLTYNSVCYVINSINTRIDDLRDTLEEFDDDREDHFYKSAFTETAELGNILKMLEDHCSRVEKTKYFKESRRPSPEQVEEFYKLFGHKFNRN